MVEKILFTSVGRRVELVQAFRTAAQRVQIDLEIYGADVSETAPAGQFCDHRIKVCRIDDEAYIPQLLEICKRHQIDALIPTIDTDLLILAENKARFERQGTKVFVSAPEMVRVCRDKRKTEDFFAECGLEAPHTVDDIEKYKQGFPAFMKPLNGSSSIDAYKINNREELVNYSHRVKDYIVQPYIEGREYTVDIFCDYEGNPVYITPRERLAVRSGEVLKTQICQDEEMIAQMQQLIKKFRPCGAITVQLIRQNNTGTCFYIEINPRFGGGAPLSIKAGADSAEGILRILNGEHLQYQEYAANDKAVYSRFDQSVCILKGIKR